jgi:hypothetical protein
MKITRRYLPCGLTARDRKKQSAELRKSRRAYRHGKYHTRAPITSFKSRPSSHVARAKRMYGVSHIGATAKLARATGCTRAALAKIINKGAGAYYSSGSRPNQTAQSWGVARLASAITGGKAAAVDYAIIEKGCRAEGRARILARRARRKHGHGTHRVPKTRM